MASSFREFRFGWHVVFASAFGIGLGLSPLPFYTIGVFVAPLKADLGWSTSQVLSGLAVLTGGALIMSPVIGLLTDRLGVRKVVLTSIVLFSCTMMAFSLNNGSMLYYLFLWLMLAVTGAGTLPITWTRAVNGWFHERRGLALGLSLLGTGLFGAFAKLFAAGLIESVGWRMAYVGIGLLPLIIAFPLAYFMLFEATDKRVEKKVARATAEAGFDSARVLGGMTLRDALRDWRFWLLAYSFVPISFAVGGPIPNLETMMGQKGFDTRDAVVLASLIGYSVVVGRLAGGYLLDHFWAPAVAAIILSLPSVAVFMLAQSDLTFAMTAVAICILGLAAGVEYDLMAYIVSRYFGMANYASIYGFLYGFFALGAGLAPPIFAWAFDTAGNYDGILKVAAVLFLAGALPLLLLGKYRNFDGAQIVADEEGPHA